jgi:hypothetical protein
MDFDLQAFLDEYEWQMEELEPGFWHAVFSTEYEEDFDLFALFAEEWLHLSVTPFTPRPAGDGLSRLAPVLLRLNERLPLVRFTLDDDDDIALRCDLPIDALSNAIVAAAFDMLTAGTVIYARPLSRMVADPAFWPKELVEAGIKP